MLICVLWFLAGSFWTNLERDWKNRFAEGYLVIDGSGKYCYQNGFGYLYQGTHRHQLVIW